LGLVVTSLLGRFAMLTPWSLVGILPAAVMDVPLPMPIWLPIRVTAALSAFFVAVTLWKFKRLEFKRWVRFLGSCIATRR